MGETKVCGRFSVIFPSTNDSIAMAIPAPLRSWAPGRQIRRRRPRRRPHHSEPIRPGMDGHNVNLHIYIYILYILKCNMYINIALNNYIYITLKKIYIHIYIYIYVHKSSLENGDVSLYHPAHYCPWWGPRSSHYVTISVCWWQSPFFDGAMTIPHYDPISLIVIIQLLTMTYKQKSDILCQTEITPPFAWKCAIFWTVTPLFPILARIHQSSSSRLVRNLWSS